MGERPWWSRQPIVLTTTEAVSTSIAGVCHGALGDKRGANIGRQFVEAAEREHISLVAGKCPQISDLGQGQP